MSHQARRRAREAPVSISPSPTLATPRPATADTSPSRPDAQPARRLQAGAVSVALAPSALRNHSGRAYTWGATIAALHGIAFDRELLYVAAMFHDTGIPSPVPHVDFTVRSAALAREFTDSHDVPADIRELVANAIAMHYTPASASNPVPRDTSGTPAAWG
jgi:HD domain-containing protein